MNDDILAGTIAETVTPRGVHAYLVAHGWTRTGAYRVDRGDVYRRSGDRETVLVPASTRFADYPIRILQLAEIVGRAENRRRTAVLADLSLAAVDLIRVRLPGAHDDHSLALDAGVDLLAGARKLLLAAACSALRPQRLFRAGRHERASTYLAGVRLGPTEPCSFVVNLRVSVSPSLAEPDQFNLFAPPFERRANRTLVAGLRAAREATDLVHRGDHVRAFDQRVPEGVSANLCTAAAELVDAGGGLEVSVRWGADATRGRRKGRAARNRDVSASGRPRAPRGGPDFERPAGVDERIEGYVLALASDQSEPEGRATIKAVIDGALTSVKADFSPAAYSTIAKAHDNRWSVSLEGDLRREGHRWYLSNPRHLTVMDDTDP